MGRSQAWTARTQPAPPARLSCPSDQCGRPRGQLTPPRSRSCDGPAALRCCWPLNAYGLAIRKLLGIILDGIPESIVIGLDLLEHNIVSVSMLVAIFLSNLPEAVAGTVGMKESGW
jgi:hypothetical protein